MSLLLQPSFPAGDASERRSFRTISQARIPDLVLTVEGPGQPSGGRFIVLDAKYRTSREAVLSAMESAHLYHDALRKNHVAPDLALIIVPARGWRTVARERRFPYP